jgi:hypothetical protein
LSVALLASTSSTCRERVARRAVHLRHAAQRVGVLHARVAVAVALADLALGQQRAQALGAGRLPGVRPRAHDRRVKGVGRAAQRLEGHGASHVGRLHRPLGAEERERADPRHHLRAVVERQPLLGLQPQRLHAGLAKRLGAAHRLAAHLGPSLADQHQRQVRQRRQVARGAHRALLGDHRVHAVVQEVEQALDHHRAHAREAARQHVGAQQGDGARLGAPQRGAGAAGVAADQVELQFLDPLVRDHRLGQPPEAGVDAVDHRAAGDRVLHHRARANDARLHARRQRDHGGGAGRHAPDVFQRQRVAVDLDPHQNLFSPCRVGNGAEE